MSLIRREPNQLNIFISYFESEALDLAEAVREDLKHHGYSAYVAKIDLKKGERQDVVIMKRIRECQIFIPIITSGALISAWVNKEVTEAQKMGKRIIPCKHKSVRWSDLKKWNLSDVNGIEFRLKEELLRELIPHVLDNLGKIQGMSMSFTIKVNKRSYWAKEPIKITGTVPAIIEGVPVGIQVLNPENATYTIDLVTPYTDGTYSTTIMVGGRLGLNGIYTVKAIYAGQNLQIKFEITGAQVRPEGTVRVESGGKIWNVRASLTNGRILGIAVDPDLSSIIIPVSTSETKNGEIEMALPRDLIDARINSKDDDFIVLVDGEEEKYTQTETIPTSRTLKIPIPAGTEEIEVIGTIVVPKEITQENVGVVMISEGASSPSNPRFYVPKEMRISRTTKVVWINADSAGHTVTSGTPEVRDFGSKFDSTADPSGFLIKARATFEHTFDEVGEFPYFCQVHPHEVGKIIVQE